MRGAALELVALSKRFGPTVAVDNINLKIAPGTYCCLLGPSGCGKTSTLRMIAGHEPVSSGDHRQLDHAFHRRVTWDWPRSGSWMMP